MTISHRDRLLRSSLLANGIFSLASGTVMFVADGLTAALLGTLQAVWLISLCGLGVFLFGAFVVWLSRRAPVPAGLARLVIAADLAWVAGSWLLIGATSWLSTQGAWTVAIVADVVLLFAVLQWLGLKRAGAAVLAAA